MAYELKQTQDRELRLYYFITKNLIPAPIGQQNASVKEGVLGIMGYDLDNAVREANEAVIAGTNLVLAGSVSMQSFLDRIEKKAENDKPSNEPQEKMAKATFIASVKLAANEYITDESDRKAIISIIEKIEQN